MALYAYEAFSKEGKRIKGILDAASVGEVRLQLAKQNLYPITIYLSTQESRQGLFKRLFQGSVSLKNKILLTKQLAVLLKSGVPLLQALELLTEQFEGRLRTILINVKDEVKGGTSLADALSKYPKIFDTIYVQLVKAGEASGKLDAILERLTEYLERREEVKSKIRSAMQYPIIQMVIAIGVVLILITVVVPQMQGLFEAQGEKLPMATKTLLALSDLIKKYYLLLIIGVITIVGSFLYWKKTPSGSYLYDKMKLKIPVIKYITKTNAVVQFSYTLGLLMESGVNLAQALDIVVKIIDNHILAQTLMQARDKIIKQGNIAQYLKQTEVFPPIAIHLIRTGEQTGELGPMLMTVAQNYEVELKELIDTATGLINPIMLVFMGVVVGFIVMAIAGPITGGAEAFNLQG